MTVKELIVLLSAQVERGFGEREVKFAPRYDDCETVGDVIGPRLVPIDRDDDPAVFLYGER